MACLQVLLHAVRALRRLHAFGYAHRDIKPGNILRRPKQHDWTLIDFGCTARTGALPPVIFTKHSLPLQSCWAQVCWSHDTVATCLGSHATVVKYLDSNKVLLLMAMVAACKSPQGRLPPEEYTRQSYIHTYIHACLRRR